MAIFEHWPNNFMYGVPSMKTKIASVVSLLVIFVASFGDEVAAITFSFSKVDQTSMLQLSLLMTCPMLGGLLSTPLSIFLLNWLRPKKMLALVLTACGLVCLLAVLVPFEFLDYVACFTLGALGTMFWSALNVEIANRFAEDELWRINQLSQSIRNAGYILAPMIAGFVSGKLTGDITLIGVAVVFLLSVIAIPGLFGPRPELMEFQPQASKGMHTPRVAEFLRLPRMTTTMLPLSVTILTTSVFNVAFIHHLLVDNGMSKIDYGFIVSGISIGLVLGPFLMRPFKQNDHATTACLAASVIGICVALAGVFLTITPLFITLVILGVANSIQNVSMSTLTMKLIPKDRRGVLMPTYISLIQASVLSGFLIAGVIPTRYSAAVLLGGGAIAMLAGLLGAVLNSQTKVAKPCSA